MLHKLTKSFVDKVSFEQSGQIFYRDSELLGFGLRVGKSAKVYYAEAKLHGKTVRKSIARHNVVSLDEARSQAKSYLAEISRGKNPHDEEKARKAKLVTLSEVLENYIEARGNLQRSTIQDYRHTFDAYLHDWLKKPAIEISKDMVELKFRKISQTSPSQANKTMRNFRAVMNYAIMKYEDSNGDSIFRHNPVIRITQLRAWHRAVRRDTLIKHYDLAPWYQAVMNLSNDSIAPNREVVKDFLLLVLFTGLRRNEAAKLTWNRVDLKDKTIVIKDTKNHTDHILPLTDFLHDLLTKRKAEAKTKYVFPNETNTGYMTDPKKQIANVIKESGVNFSTHDLRRTFITIAESLDISAYALKRLLNHKMTNDVTAGYIISDVERLRVPMQKITDYILYKIGQKEKADVIPIQMLQASA
ncbi:tyrosine-type recombinase/integrase [Methylotenera sp. L2L1]|uniref:tyrosine-type recombinase/integrase n=1 Tax=Methylotenera sp. L2L1 TaxID=1502770 RepID=UPI00056D6A8A|nr:tyrosine-type recombinase/integrase [Methylotenera sp. L2L1]